MVDYVGKKMIVDTRSGDGGAYFEQDYFEWRCRDTRREDLTIRIKYQDIKEVRIIRGRKKRVEVYLNDGKYYFFWLYKAATFAQFINAGREGYKLLAKKLVEETHNDSKDIDLDRLSKLAELHNSGALTDEEFQKLKEEIINK